MSTQTSVPGVNNAVEKLQELGRCLYHLLLVMSHLCPEPIA